MTGHGASSPRLPGAVLRLGVSPFSSAMLIVRCAAAAAVQEGRAVGFGRSHQRQRMEDAKRLTKPQPSAGPRSPATPTLISAGTGIASSCVSTMHVGSGSCASLESMPNTTKLMRRRYRRSLMDMRPIKCEADYDVALETAPWPLARS